MTEPIIETPKGSIIINQNGKAELKWNTNFKSERQNQFSAVQKYVDSEVLRLSEPYTPFLSGMLVMSGTLGTNVGSGTVQWIAPYAKYQYYGKVMAGNPKKPTAKNLVYHGGGLRGAFWFERMKAANLTKILNGARQIAGAK